MEYVNLLKISHLSPYQCSRDVHFTRKAAVLRWRKFKVAIPPPHLLGSRVYQRAHLYLTERQMALHCQIRRKINNQTEGSLSHPHTHVQDREGALVVWQRWHCRMKHRGHVSLARVLSFPQSRYHRLSSPQSWYCNKHNRSRTRLERNNKRFQKQLYPLKMCLTSGMIWV